MINQIQYKSINKARKLNMYKTSKVYINLKDKMIL